LQLKFYTFKAEIHYILL